MYCPECGTEISEDSDFCMNCGVEIESNKLQNEKAETETTNGSTQEVTSDEPDSGIETDVGDDSSGRGRLIIGGIIVVVGIIVLIFSHQQLQEAQTVAGQVGRAVSGERQSQYQLFSITRIGGGALAAVGLLLSASAFTGSVVSKNATTTTKQNSPTEINQDNEGTGNKHIDTTQKSGSNKIGGGKILLAGVFVFFVISPILALNYVASPNFVDGGVGGLGIILLLFGIGRLIRGYL